MLRRLLAVFKNVQSKYIFTEIMRLFLSEKCSRMQYNVSLNRKCAYFV